MTPLPRRVLHVLNSAGGGAAETTISLIRGLRDHGIESVAVCHTSGSPAERERLAREVDGRVEYVRLYWWGQRTRARWWKRPMIAGREIAATRMGRQSADRVVAFATAQQVDLIHTNTILTPEGARAARIMDLPHVWHLREMVGPGHTFRFWFEQHRFRDLIAPSCDVLVANSSAAAALIRAWVPDELITVVPNGIEIDRFDACEQREDPNPVRVGMVANLTSHWKRHDLFVEAAAQVRRDCPAVFELIGHDPVLSGQVEPYAKALHDRVDAAGLGDRFRFAGFFPDPVEIMDGIDVLVHPCGEESFGRIVVEAMSAARPVVGVAAGGVGELVDDDVTGILVAPEDVAGLARSIELLVADPELRHRMGRAGRQRARDHYSLEAMTTGMLDVYGKAIARHGGSYHPDLTSGSSLGDG